MSKVVAAVNLCNAFNLPVPITSIQYCINSVNMQVGQCDTPYATVLKLLVSASAVKVTQTLTEAVPE